MLVIVVKSTALLSWQLDAIKLQLLSSLNNGKEYFLPYNFKPKFVSKNIQNIIFCDYGVIRIEDGKVETNQWKSLARFMASYVTAL